MQPPSLNEIQTNLPLQCVELPGTEAIIHMPVNIQRVSSDNLNHPFLELSAELHCIVSREGHLCEIRGAWERILGWSITELLGTRYVELVHPEDVGKTNEEHSSITEGNATRGFRNRYRCKNGAYRWLEWRALPIDDNGMIYAVASDRGDTSQVLTSSLLFEELIHNVQDPVYVISADEAGVFRMLYVNEAGARHFRCAREEALKLSVSDFDPAYSQENCVEFLQLLRRERRQVFETVHKLGDGTLIPVEVSATYLVLGEEKLIAGTIRDISERRNLLESIEQHAVQLEGLNRELEQLTYIASHDLREPLRTIFSHLELVRRGSEDKLDSKTLANVNFTIDAAQRLNRLIQDLLSYGAIREHALKVTEVDLNALASEVVSDLRKRIEETGAEISIGNLGPVKADSSLMRSLLQNILTNALKFTDPSRSPRVCIRLEEDATTWQLKVSDNGIGIETEDLDRVFRMFQRLHAQGQYPGSGLGLAICDKIAKAHGGRIWATSHFGQGSEFVVELPKTGLLPKKSPSSFEPGPCQTEAY